MKGYRTGWAIPDQHRERVEAGARIVLGRAVYGHRTALGLVKPRSRPELASRGR